MKADRDMISMVQITLGRAIALQRKETDRQKRTRRKAFMFVALYSGPSNDETTILMPVDLVEQGDLHRPNLT